MALFAAGGVGGQQRVHACVSRSTRGMRAAMLGPGNALEFEMPLAPAGAAHDLEERHLKELQELGNVSLTLHPT